MHSFKARKKINRRLFFVRQIVESDLIKLLNCDKAYDFDIYRKVEHIWSFFGPINYRAAPDWTKYKRPSSDDAYAILEYIFDNDFIGTERVVRRLARAVTVVR